MLVVLPTTSGESSSWSWLSGWAPCSRRKEAFSIRPRSTARKRGVSPREVRHSRESRPETGAQDKPLHHPPRLCFLNYTESVLSEDRPLYVSSRMVWLLWAAASCRGVQPLLSVCENFSLCPTHRSFRSFSLPGGTETFKSTTMNQKLET